MDKIRVGREIGKNFLLVKTSGYNMVVILAAVLACKCERKTAPYTAETMMKHDVNLT